MTGSILPLPRLLVEPVVRAALLEDLGRAGDITTDAIVPADARLEGVIAARQAGVISGVDAAAIAFALIDPAVKVEIVLGDGAPVAPGDVVIRLSGPARAILTAERVALNLLCRMSGVATATAGLVAAAKPHGK
ncbi:nicotinate-nucleotide diphosphorylase, partial [Methylobacterium trifolii]